MHICFVSYWGLNEGLTRATILPHLEILAARNEVEQITFITIERKGKVQPYTSAKVRHETLETTEAISKKLFDKSKAKKLLDKVHKEKAIDVLLARSSLAGWLVLDLAKARGIPLIVESFEPHADYMLESGVWKRMDPRYIMAKSAEKRLKKHAQALLPVTRRYADHLVHHEHVDPQRVFVMPCCVDTQAFAFSASARTEVRKELKISEASVVGVYTGKLGGIYLDKEALQLFHSAHDYWNGQFHLIVLSPDEKGWLEALRSSKFDEASMSIRFVDQNQVSRYLSAADFAYSLHRPGPSKMGISPIKNAEYFANGLPVLMPQGIGDDALMIEQWELGVTFGMDELDSQAMLNRLKPLVQQRLQSKRISNWAHQHRSFDIVRRHYETILGQIQH